MLLLQNLWERVLSIQQLYILSLVYPSTVYVLHTAQSQPATGTTLLVHVHAYSSALVTRKQLSVATSCSIRITCNMLICTVTDCPNCNPTYAQ